jgi:hypothetical protein
MRVYNLQLFLKAYGIPSCCLAIRRDSEDFLFWSEISFKDSPGPILGQYFPLLPPTLQHFLPLNTKGFTPILLNYFRISFFYVIKCRDSRLRCNNKAALAISRIIFSKQEVSWPNGSAPDCTALVP